MGSRYKGSSARGRMTAYAAKGPHWAAKNAPEKVDETFSPGERARLARTGQEVVVGELTSFGYEVEGQRGYFLAGDLEKI